MLLEPRDQVLAASGGVDDGVDALIREARRRTHRRRLRRLAVFAVVAGAAGLAYAVLLSGGSGVIAGTASSPFVNVRAFEGQGNLAFVSRDRLWVLDGSAGALRSLPRARHQEALSPTFSHDGRWLAYLTHSTNPNRVQPYELWIAHADGSGVRAIGSVNGLVGWSPHADAVAVTVGRQVKYPPVGSATMLELVWPGGRRRTLLKAPAKPATLGGVDAVMGAVWSPDGSALAVALGGGLADAIDTVPVALGSRPTVWFARRGAQPVKVTGMSGAGPTQVIPDLAGWWPGWGIAFWIFDGGGIRDPDNTPLAVVATPGARPRLVAQTLSSGITDAVSPGANDKLALVATSTPGVGRTFGIDKTVETCKPARGCGAVPRATVWSGPNTQTCNPCIQPGTPRGEPGSGVSQDPSWSPTGGLLAYVKAPVADTGAWPSDAWFADHAVYVLNTRTGATKRIGTVDGAALPIWSGDGRDLLYESSDGLWLMPIASGRPVEIEHPLYSEAEWNTRTSHAANISYYGQIPWNRQFSWSSG